MSVVETGIEDSYYDAFAGVIGGICENTRLFIYFDVVDNYLIFAFFINFAHDSRCRILFKQFFGFVKVFRLYRNFEAAENVIVRFAHFVGNTRFVKLTGKNLSFRFGFVFENLCFRAVRVFAYAFSLIGRKIPVNHAFGFHRYDYGYFLIFANGFGELFHNAAVEIFFDVAVKPLFKLGNCSNG